MLRFGQSSSDPNGTPPPPRRAGIRTFTLRDFALDPLHRRPHLLDRHLLLLVTVGHGTQEVDFRSYPCRPGSLIWAQPGQVVHHGEPGGLDAILVSWAPEAVHGLGVAPVAAPPGGTGYWQLAGEDEDAVINEVSQLVVDCQRHRGEAVAVDLLRHQLAVLLLRLALLPTAPADPPGYGPLPSAAWRGRPTGSRLATDVPGSTSEAASDHGSASGAADGATTGHGATGGAAGGPGTAGSAGWFLGGTGRMDGNGSVGRSRQPDAAVDESGGTYRRLRHEIERSYGQTRRVEDYAGRLGCSVRTLTRACLAATGRSAKQIVDARVALEAMRLLAATDLPVAEIGRRLGFTEPTNFGRFFQREVGQSPGAFRLRQRGPARSGTVPIGASAV
ncbi:helix-turn-helix transcriptional regulator [Plantactinospora sonchi]|uniref:AraC family transcriptional regulator n=1 Tax=Plantactinospora sonchi TaxID=1544735 RepID=A0ABU7RR91_9ACTN